MIKKIIGFLCSVIFCTTIAVGMPQMAEAAEEIAINETNFPDEIFREYVISEFDKDKNNKLSEEEIAEVTYINVDEKGIGSLKGVEYFTALTDLACYNNQLTTLDISKNTTLIYLRCDYNQLITLDISKNTALTNLDCASNSLTTLDVNNNTDLTYLRCNYNQLTALDISKNTELTNLYCDNNQLTALDVSKNTTLTSLYCDNNQLTALDVSNNTALTNLSCGDNQLTDLDISNNTALIELSCNQLTALDVSNNTALTYLYCSNNWDNDKKLTALDISKNTALTRLYCYNNQLTALDVSKNTALTELICSNNQLIALDISNNIALTNLNCGGNQLKVLDINKNTMLTDLDCSANQLTALDLSKNTALTGLHCSNNQLTALDISKNTALTYLDCSNNQLTALDISKNMGLTNLYCFYNPLTQLKLHSQTYDTLPLYKEYLNGYGTDISNLQNVTETETKDSWDNTIFLLKVTDITKPATYKVDGKNFTIIYADTVIMPSAAPSSSPSAVPSPVPSSIPTQTPSPSASPVISTNNHIFIDYNYNIPVSGSAIIYGNGISKTIDGKKVNNKALTVYTDITASYKYTLNNRGIVKPSIGKVIVGITKSDIKPEVSSKNKITDTSASNIAKARIKNGQITVTSVGREGGLVYLWVIDTGNKGVSACCPINVKLAPKKLEAQDTSGSKLKDTKIVNGNTLEVCVAGLVGSAKTDDCTYTATVDQKYSSYITVTPVQDSKNRFTIKATGLKNNKDTKVSITFTCDQNGKKTKFALTITK